MNGVEDGVVAVNERATSDVVAVQTDFGVAVLGEDQVGTMIGERGNEDLGVAVMTGVYVCVCVAYNKITLCTGCPKNTGHCLISCNVKAIKAIAMK